MFGEFFFVDFRWIKSLEDGKFSEKYSLKEVPFKGKALKKVKKYSFLITSILQNMGIKKEKDQKRILKHIENLVEKYPNTDKKQKKKIGKKKEKVDDGENPETDSSVEENPASSSSSSSDDYPD